MIKGSTAVIGISAVVVLMLLIPFLSVNATSGVYYEVSAPGCAPNSATCVVSLGATPWTPLTNDSGVTSVTLSLTPISAPGGTGATGLSTCTGGSPNTCSTVSLTANAKGTWKLVANFNGFNGILGSYTQTVNIGVIVTPQFPVGLILAVLAPIAALIGYSKFRKPAFPKIKA
jgi:hypothetical protein